MRQALALAADTPVADVPIAALVIGADGAVLGEGVNRRETDQDPAGHAEVIALRAAAAATGSWRLDGCTLVVTVEPCTMCAGASVGARVDAIVFGAYEPKTGACGSLLDVVSDPRLLHRPQVRGGVLEEQCAGLVQEFFRQLR